MLNDLTFNRICLKTDEGNSSHLQLANNFISKLMKLDSEKNMFTDSKHMFSGRKAFSYCFRFLNTMFTLRS